jgi:acylphosphatase
MRAIVRGRVQGVGFRYFVLRRAEALGLRGWVRNLPDGRQVEIEAEGAEEAVESLLAAVRQGPLGARVDEVVVESLPPREGGADGFAVY